MNRNGLTGNADVASRDPAVADETRGDEFCHVDGDGEADALCRQNDRGIHADYFATGVDERSAGVARVERGVRLDHAIDQSSASRPHGASERTDDAGRHRGLETERAANRNRQLTGTDQVGVAKPRRNLIRRRYAHDGQIGIRVVADHAGSAARAVDERDVD